MVLENESLPQEAKLTNPQDTRGLTKEVKRTGEDGTQKVTKKDKDGKWNRLRSSEEGVRSLIQPFGAVPSLERTCMEDLLPWRAPSRRCASGH
jgi:hypothetical protein